MTTATAKATGKKTASKKNGATVPAKASAEKEATTKLDKVVEPMVDEHLAKHDLVVEGDGLREKCDRLAAYYAQKIPAARLLNCTTCGFDSDRDEQCCPFCGDGEVVEPETSGKAEAVAAEVPKGEEASKKPRSAAPASKKTNGAAKSSDGEKAPPSVPAAPKSGAAETTTGPDGQALVLARKGKKSETVVATEAHVVSAEELDKAIDEVQKAKQAAVFSYWELGRAIFLIYERKLFLERRDGSNNPKYKNWSQFVSTELRMTPAYSYKLMDVAANFTREDVEAIGTTKLGILLKLPEAARAELVEKAKKGLPRSKLADEVRKLAGSGPRRETGRKKTPAGGGRKAKPAGGDAPDGSITVAMVLGRVKIPLFARPKKAGAAELRAKKLGDDPHGVEQLANGVEVRYVVTTTAKGELQLVIERRRSTS